MNVMKFDALREYVSKSDIINLLDLQVNRADFMRCPLHRDNHASLKLYDDGFHCFSCQESGDFIHLASIVWGVKEGTAYTRIADAVGFECREHEARKYSKVANQQKTYMQAIKRWYDTALDYLAEDCRRCWNIILHDSDDVFVSRAKLELSSSEHLHDEMLNCKPEEAYRKYSQLDYLLQIEHRHDLFISLKQKQHGKAKGTTNERIE